MDEENYLIKGQAIIGLINYIKERKGQKGVDQIFSILKKEAREFYIAPDEIKTKKMYQDRTFIKLMEILDREFGTGDLSECYNFGVYDSKHLGVMGYFVSFLGTPSAVISKAPKSWRYYHNKGELVVTELKPGQGVIQLRDFLDSKAFCTQLLGFFNGAAKQTKGKNVNVEKTRCTENGDDVCEFRITWDE